MVAGFRVIRVKDIQFSAGSLEIKTVCLYSRKIAFRINAKAIRREKIDYPVF